MRGTWGVEPAPGGNIVTMKFDILPKYGALGRMLIGAGLKLAFSGLCERLLDKWQARILSQPANPSPRRRDAA